MLLAILLGKYSEDREPIALYIRQASKRLCDLFPTLLSFLHAFPENKASAKDINGGQVMITSILSH